VFSGNSSYPSVLYSEKVPCELGKALDDTARLEPSARALVLPAVIRFFQLAKNMNLEKLEVIATAAIREAVDGAELVEEIAEKTGLVVRVLSCKDEGCLSAYAVTVDYPNASGVVVDLGGASMEMTHIQKGEVKASFSVAVGLLRLMESRDSESVLETKVHRLIEEVVSKLSLKDSVGSIYLIGGAFKAFARVCLVATNSPLRVTHYYSLTSDALRLHLKNFSDRSDRNNILDSASAKDKKKIPTAVYIVKKLLEIINPDTVLFSNFGVREGLFCNVSHFDRNREDGLLSRCAQLENTYARFPGFGFELFTWLQPILDQNISAERLVQACCLLCNTAWSKHRPQSIHWFWGLLDSVELGGINHTERMVMLSILAKQVGGNSDLCLLGNRYNITPEGPALRVIVRAIRLGKELAGGASGILKLCSLVVEQEKLVLVFSSAEIEGLKSAEVLKRLQSLAKSMKLVGVIDVS
jgi:exopolyphosphatase/guanosine-5'-triphosphate,3'-diphosphate pyrophosphatase